jgi:hypothetical protein
MCSTLRPLKAAEDVTQVMVRGQFTTEYISELRCKSCTPAYEAGRFGAIPSEELCARRKSG